MSRNHFTDISLLVDPQELKSPSESELIAGLKFVERCHLSFQRKLGESVVAAFEAGATLLASKQMTAHGEWGKTLRKAIKASGVDLNVRTCQRYIRVAELLLSLPASPASEHLDAQSKTTRVSFLRFLCEEGLLSINKVLALKSKERAQGESSPLLLTGSSEDVALRESFRTPENEPEFLTPQEILKVVLQLLGAIDLDPCASEVPSLHLPAKDSIAPPADGLSTGIIWAGRIYVHPPGDKILPFAIRSVAAIEDGEAEAVLLLVPAVTDADYMATLQPYPKGFLHSRPTFATPSRELVRPCTPYALVLVSKDAANRNDFPDVVGQIADIYYPHRFV